MITSSKNERVAVWENEKYTSNLAGEASSQEKLPEPKCRSELIIGMDPETGGVNV
jgi:hypothetical protein